MEVNPIVLDNKRLVTVLNDEFANNILRHNIFRGLLTIDILSADIFKMVSFLHNNPNLNFELLVDIAGVDYLEFEDEAITERFAVIYIFYSFLHNLRIKIRAFVSEKKAEVDSIYQVFKGAGWAEREVFDMYGIHFRNHPDLKRILMPEDFGANPLRKDYPLEGRGERDNFPDYNLKDRRKRE